jgi:hypothetical protein
MRKSTHSKITIFAFSTLAFASCGKDQNPGVGSTVNAKQFFVPLGTVPQLDLVFMIDNSPSMAPKQEKLRAQFPKLINALKNPGDGSLPDLRVAIIDSDLGTGGAYSAGRCGPKTLSDGTPSRYGDMGRFQMLGATACGVTDPTARWLEYQGGAPLNFAGDLNAVFSCLAANIGTNGCGMEQQLQSYVFALLASGVGNESQQTILRPGAYLGLVFLSDEDDCSASPNDGMYGMNSELLGESASLRCATRAHVCEGKKLTNSPPGYPTTVAFEAPFATCSARTDACSNSVDGNGAKGTDTSGPTSCSPLRSISKMASDMKKLKEYPGEQVLVSGIFGWPLSDADMATATYKIGLVPNPNTMDTAHPTLFDYLPICYDPNHLPTSPDPATGVDVEALGYGATGGLRMSAFVDEFGANGQKFSICQPDFTAAMSQIGVTLSKKMRNQCVPTSYTQTPQCTASYETPDGAAKAIPVCDATESVVPCYSLVSDQNLCPGDASLVHLNRGTGATDQVPAGTWLVFSCP